MSSESAESLPSEQTEEREPCPAPLLWQDIVTSFQEEIRQGEISFANGSVTATQYGQGPPLVFLPGTATTPRLYALLAWLLKDERQCWILETPQFQAAPEVCELIPATASAYEQVLKELFGGPVNIYAAGYSVPVCIQMLLEHSEQVHKAILQSGWAHYQLTSFEQRLLQFGKHLPVRLRNIPLWKTSQVQNHRPWFPPYDETRFQFLISETGRLSTAEVSCRLLAGVAIDLTQRLAEINKPTMVIQAEGEGEAILNQGQLLAKSIPGCRLEELHTTGHYPFLTHPHRLVKLLRDFFEIPKSEPTQVPNNQVKVENNG